MGPISPGRFKFVQWIGPDADLMPVGEPVLVAVRPFRIGSGLFEQIRVDGELRLQRRMEIGALFQATVPLAGQDRRTARGTRRRGSPNAR